MKTVKPTSSKLLIAIGIVLLATAVISYAGIIPSIIAGSIADNPQDPRGNGLLISITPTQGTGGRTLVYVKIEKNGETVYESYFPSGPPTSPLDIVVYSEPGDIISTSAKWDDGLSMYIKVKIVKYPEETLETGCIEVLEAGRSSEGDPDNKAIVMNYYKYLGDSSYTPSAPLWIYASKLDVTEEPTATATLTQTATATTTTVISTTTITTTTTIVDTETITTTTTVVNTATITETITTTYVTTITVTRTQVHENPYSQNIVMSIILGIAGTISLVLGFRKPV